MRRRSPPEPDTVFPPPPPPPSTIPIAPPATHQRVPQQHVLISPPPSTIKPPLLHPDLTEPTTNLLLESPKREKEPPKPIVIRPPIPPQHVYAPMPALGALSMLGRKSKKDKEKEEEDYRLIVNGNYYTRASFGGWDPEGGHCLLPTF